MIGLTSMTNRGVIWKVNMAYDVLYNEVGSNDVHNHNNQKYLRVQLDFVIVQAMVYLLMVKYDVDYDTAVEYHLKEFLPNQD